MNKDAPYQESCFCGAVQFTLSGSASGQGYCHCESCRQWSAGSVNYYGDSLLNTLNHLSLSFPLDHASVVSNPFLP